MSSSKKKQARNEQRMTERQSSAAQEAKKLKHQTIAFWVVIVLVMALFVGALANEYVVSPVVNGVNNITFPKTEAVTVGDHTLTSVDLNYYYVSAVQTFYNNVYSMVYQQYYYYVSLGMDISSIVSMYLPFSFATDLTKQPLSAANKTTYETEAATWADYFMEQATENIKTYYSVYDLAQQKSHELTEEEQANLDKAIASLDADAKDNGFRSVKSYLRSIYGNGANKDSYVEFLTVTAYANSYFTAYKDSLEFTDEQLKTFGDAEDKAFEYNSYTYAYYKINVADYLTGGTKDDNGNIKYESTEAEKAAYKAARALAKAAADKLAKGEYATLEDFRAAVIALDKEIQELTKKDDTSASKAADSSDKTDDKDDKDDKDEDKKDEDKDPTNYTNQKRPVLYSNISTILGDWLVGKTEKEEKSDDGKTEYTFTARKEGELGVVANTTDEDEATVFYVIRYNSCTDNAVLMKNVRHILIKCAGTEQDDGTIKFTDADKAKEAKKKAEDLLEEFLKDATEEKFKALALKNSEDTGSKSDGGLYPDIYPGQMVTQFEDWCFAEERKAGDTAIVETVNGYHIMYFVSDSEQTYRYSMVEDDLRDETAEDWLEEMADSIKFTLLTDKHLKTDFS